MNPLLTVCRRGMSGRLLFRMRMRQAQCAAMRMLVAIQSSYQLYPSGWKARSIQFVGGGCGGGTKFEEIKRHGAISTGVSICRLKPLGNPADK